jgi:hypothetical protein
LLDYQKQLDDIKKKEMYREVVKKRNLDLIDDKKNRTLWRLEKIDMKGGRHLRGKLDYGSTGSEDQVGNNSRTSI